MTGFTPEQSLIPYEASVFTASRALVLAPHPDDEVFGCGAALAYLRERRAAVVVLVLTDGAGDEPDPVARRRIAQRRLAESETALAQLGGGELRAAGFRDRGLWDAGPALRDAVEAALRDVSPDLVLAPSPVEIHPDHRAAAAALVAVSGGAAAPVLAAATVAFFELSQPIRPNFLLDCGVHAAAKGRAMAAFASQAAERDYAGFVSGLNAYRAMTLPPGTAAAEGYFVVPGGELARGLPFLARAMSPFAGTP